MNFGERQEMVEKFLDLCDEMDLTLTERREKIEEVENDIEDYDHYDLHTLSKVRDRVKNTKFCPVCAGELFYDEENYERYCPRCVNNEQPKR